MNRKSRLLRARLRGHFSHARSHRRAGPVMKSMRLPVGRTHGKHPLPEKPRKNRFRFGPMEDSGENAFVGAGGGSTQPTCWCSSLFFSSFIVAAKAATSAFGRLTFTVR